MVVRPAAGGMKEHVLALSAGLAEAGHRIEMAAPHASGVAQSAREAGLTVYEIPLVGELNPLSDPRAIAALRRVIRAGSFDVIHAHGFKAGLVARLGARLSGSRSGRTPVVVTAHNHVLFREDTPRSTKSRYRAVERALSGLVARYIAVSQSIARELTQAYGLPAEKVTVVYNGVDPAPFSAPQDRAASRAELGLPRPDVVVGLAARFSAQKGLRHLVAAVPALRKALTADGRELLVAIGGSGPLESELREQAAAIEASGTIRWLGHVESMPRFLSALDVYVSPAETEALGIGLIEAAIAGVPTVATDVGGVSEVIVDGETGVLVAPRDPSGLADAVLGVLRDPEGASAMAVAARARCLLKFAPGLMIERTLGVYAEVLAEIGAASPAVDASAARPNAGGSDVADPHA